MRDYTGKTIFVGIDVHKKTYSVTAICEGLIIKRDTLKASPTVLIAYLKKFFGTGKIRTAYEAGFCGFHLHRALIAVDIFNIVVHAASIETSKDRVKTDKRDSLKIATHLSLGKLKGINVPTEEREDFRTVTRLRDTFCGERNRISCQIKSLLYTQGLIGPDDGRRVSERWIKDLFTLEVAPGLKFALEQFAKMWLMFNEKIKEIDVQIKAQAIQDKAIDKVYQSASGVGSTTSRILANELGDLQQFKNERQLFSYVGVTPSEYSSGEHVRQGHITKQGKPILRKILVQAAWTAIRNDSELRIIFERIAMKAGRKRAIIAIARRLIGRIRACFAKGMLYEKRSVNTLQGEHTKEENNSNQQVA
jgi:transposase